MFDTIVAPASTSVYNQAARLLQAGEVVAIPTETVYGLAGNALNKAAITKIFAAKGRPRDNPLIVHITELQETEKLGLAISPLAQRLAERFWSGWTGGPLTMILRKIDNIIPSEVSCGLETVAVRVPDNQDMLEIIKRCGFPLAAPSANLSGNPSPTTAQHVYNDLNGRIPLIIDGGECPVGLESTVIAFEGEDKIRLLRPGAVTAEDLSGFAEIVIDRAVTEKRGSSENPEAVSPGVNHRHYAPKAEVVAVAAQSGEAFDAYIKANAEDGDFTLALPDDAEEQGRLLFSKLRELDEKGAKRIFARLPKPEGVGLAVYNRLVRAADFNVIETKT